MKKERTNLKNEDSEYQARKKAVLEDVKNDGRALKTAPEEMQKDKEIVLAAV